VRLRAAIAIGDLQDFHGIPVLIRALTDKNRFVRLRAATALVRFRGEEEHVLRQAMHTHDRYAVEALVSELQRADRISELARDLAHPARGPRAKSALLAALEGGSFTMLIDIALRDPQWRTRKNLARLLAGSADGLLLEQLKHFSVTALTPHQRRVAFWMAAQLRNPGPIVPAETAMTQ
jgi:predicted nucleic acid-binding protein